MRPADRWSSADPRLSVQYGNSVERQTGIVIAGSAGQKIRSTATLFAQAAMFCGLEATQKDDYPITVMTGHSLAELIFSRQRIEYTAIESPDYLLVISEDGLKSTHDQIQRLPETCIVYAEQSLGLPATKAKVVRCSIAQAAAETSRQSTAVIAVAAMLQHTGLFPLDALRDGHLDFSEGRDLRGQSEGPAGRRRAGQRLSRSRDP